MYPEGPIGHILIEVDDIAGIAKRPLTAVERGRVHRFYKNCFAAEFPDSALPFAPVVMASSPNVILPGAVEPVLLLIRILDAIRSYPH